MPRPAIFFISVTIAVLALFLPMVAAAEVHPFALIRGDNTSIEYIYSMEQALLGALAPGEEAVLSLHAELRWPYMGMEYEAAPVAVVVETGPRLKIIAGIDWEPYPPINPVMFYSHLVVYMNGGKVYDKTLHGYPWDNGGDEDATLRVYYKCNGYIELELTSGGYRYKASIEAGQELVRLYGITHEGDSARSGIHSETYQLESCGTVTNPYGHPRNQEGDSFKHGNNDDGNKLLLYAAAGLGALALLALLLRPSGVVVVGGSGRARGMVQLIGVLLLLAFAAGGLAAWKLHSLLGGGGDSNTIVYAVAGLGLLLIFLLLLSRSQSTVVVVEGGR